MEDEDRRGELCGSLDDSHDNSIFCDGCTNGATSQSNYSELLGGQNLQISVTLPLCPVCL